MTSYVDFMRHVLILMALFLTLPCGCKKQESADKGKQTEDRFMARFKDLAEIANIRQITDMQRDIEPYFTLAGDRIYFRRIVTPGQDTIAKQGIDARAGQFTYDYINNQLYLVEQAPQLFDSFDGFVPPESLPTALGEKPQSGYRTPYGLIYYTGGGAFNIYKMAGDSITQLTYGDQPSYLQSVSPNRRYVAFNYGKSFYRLVILDLATNEFYCIPRSSVDVQLYELWPQFSPDGKYLVFIVSHDIFTARKNQEDIPLGDIWLVEFKQ
jgi:hypothetical protein